MDVSRDVSRDATIQDVSRDATPRDEGDATGVTPAQDSPAKGLFMF